MCGTLRLVYWQRQRFLSSTFIQTGSGAHTVLIPAVNCEAGHLVLLVLMVRMCGSTPSCPLCYHNGCFIKYRGNFVSFYKFKILHPHLILVEIVVNQSNVCFTTYIFARVLLSFINVLLTCYYQYILSSSHLGDSSKEK